MSSRAIDTLLAELDPLPFSARQRLLAERALGLAAGGGLVRLAREADGQFEREIVLFMGIVARDGDVVAAGLRDASWRLRRRALKACGPVPVAAEALAAFVADAPYETRKEIYRLVRRRKLTELADQLFPVVAQTYAEAEAATLLAACSPALVARELAGLAHAVSNWRVMAAAHPQVMIAAARQELARATPAARQRWWHREGAGLLTLAADHPEAVFALLESFPVESLPHSCGEALAALARHDPMRLFALLDRPESGDARRRLSEPCLLRTVRSLPLPWLAGFLSRHRFGHDVRNLVLEALPPSSRAELFDSTRDHFQQPDHPTPEMTLRLLPHGLRVREARRSLGLARVREDEEATLRYTAYLDFAEAEPDLVKATGRHLADERAIGYELLLRCAARTNDEAVVSRALGMLGRLRNEQDPVRSRAIGALAEIQPRLFTAEHAEPLTELTRDALAARDSSSSTRYALSRLAVLLLARRNETAPLLTWSLSTLDLIYGTGQLPSLGQLDRVLRRGQEHEFFAAVKPWLEAGMARANHSPLFATTRALGRRAWRVAGLQTLLANTIGEHNTAHVNSQAISLWLDNPAHRSQRVQTVLLGDASTVVIPIVWNTLSCSRTDLLDLVLGGNGPSGRHLAQGVRWVPGHAPRVERWLPRQHRRYLDLLARLAGDAGASLASRVSAIRAAATVPDIGWSLVRKYCGSANTTLDEAALGALIWTDQPADALPILLSHVDDDRARVAVYALCRAVRFLAPSVIRPVLADVLNQARKVTSRKEAVRLMSVVTPRGAMTTIAAAWHPQQHRDVRAAIVATARHHLDEPPAWHVLSEAAADAERAVARSVVQIPVHDVPHRHRARYATLIGLACRHTDTHVAQAAWAAYPRWAEWAPAALTQISDAVCDLATLTLWRAAQTALVQLLDEGFTVSDLRPVFERLLLSDVDTSFDAEVDRDRPARQRLTALADRVTAWAQRQPHDTDLGEVYALGELLTRRPDHLGSGLALMVAATPLDDSLPSRLDRLCALVSDRPLAAHELAEVVLARLNRERDQLPPDLLHTTALQLCSRADLASGLLALSLARCAAASPRGWSALRDRELLRQLRRHPHPDLQALALAQTTRHE